MKCTFGLGFILLALTPVCSAADGDGRLAFGPLESLWPSPSEARLASGAPGPLYWQQRADYDIAVRIDDERQALEGEETITYHNNSPHVLRYVWLQIDNNIFAPSSLSHLSAPAPALENGTEFRSLRAILAKEEFDGRANIRAVLDHSGEPLKHTIVDTRLRIDLPQALQPGSEFVFSVHWDYIMNESKYVQARTGYEYFESDGNFIYELAHWYPRVAAYTDLHGWRSQPFLGSGEFTLEFGDFRVAITTPSDHVVAATGELANFNEVLSEEQLKRLETARSAEAPVFIVTPEEALENQSDGFEGEKTWVFEAQNVRDFAFATSRKFIWDAMEVKSGDQSVLAMSFYPNEAKELWAPYSTQAVAHTIEVYDRFTFDYPYPVAISVNGPVGGMEYPMICFNGPRNYEDGTYWGKPAGSDQWWRSKYGLISVVIHEVGHNYFPMIVNSDERRWTWMDEGLNTFLQYLAEKEWEEDYPSRRGEPRDLIEYMTSARSVPIMTESDSVLQFGNNAYAKPAVALNVLRETILGRDLFDFAFREYSQRWMFKRPQPSDFFRTIEDASGHDLDWFWRGWFYSTDHCDLSIASVKKLRIDNGDPGLRAERARAEAEAEPESVTQYMNRDMTKRVERFPDLIDFYNDYDPLDVTQDQRDAFEEYMEALDDEERDMLKDRRNFYIVTIENVGGLVSPILLDASLEGGGVRHFRFPAETWRRDTDAVRKLIITDRPIERLVLDSKWETGDADLSNNLFPRSMEEGWFPVKKAVLDESNPLRESIEPTEDSEE